MQSKASEEGEEGEKGGKLSITACLSDHKGSPGEAVARGNNSRGGKLIAYNVKSEWGKL